ncbi:TetR/AcrR family transcriptional regulator [Nocardia terpenica]|uniref:TetR/AcrR family transcriptional regulator n=1 Tax=Nocardia terpenica TaxID=455432 RepID=UPI001893DDA3|nr:TetR/AcrR family transcriptional regulator [Nocardia terpenica]MBF6065678.1 TetR/AcrR family transcriptional regulator [Nocardia terpenica]MBF6108284.1 TetR/AcrR family transcriptional regulator [Nocardia terpenica]MBF6115793.1 TetR/AcrR family transcriptional regulator [Nocardia terpenica]MBF6122923.1 TetR/AcrR family transcriptional regulator [Nocardia terpenica]MBF6156004.1 TetR/AcrR family transcriptional regulator [Nocardia terpenica]
MTRTVDNPPARTRLLEAAARLLTESNGTPITTRAICELAGVQAPTLYHHFGDKQGLLNAVAAHGFERYLGAKRARAASADPIADIRAGWDQHVQFALDNPALYAVMYGQVTPGRRPSAATEGQALLLGMLNRAAEQGRLVVAPDVAAHLILATNVGVALALIASPEQRDLGISERARDAVLGSIVREAAPDRDPGVDAVPGAAIALRAGLATHPSPDLSTAETELLKEWLRRLSGDH